MRVAMVCPYAWDVPGGVQSHIAGLSAALTDRGHDVEVLTPVADPDAVLPAGVFAGGRAVPIRYNGSTARIAMSPGAVRATRKWLQTGDFDLVHVHEPTVPSLSLIAVRQSLLPTVATFHLANDRSRLFELTGPALERSWAGLAGRVVVSEQAHQLVRNRLGPGRVDVIPNGVDVSRFLGAQPLGGRDPDRTVVFLGRLEDERKGAQLLLAALPALRRRVPGVRVLLAGPGDAARLLAPLPVELLESIEVLGPVAEEDIPSVYASGRVFCAPNTRGESFGIVLLEAMAAGTQVVASDLPAFRAVLEDGRLGLLFPQGDVDALADRLAVALLGPSTKADLAQTAVAAYDWSVVGRRIAGLYDAVLESSDDEAA
jgi:phosphatidylinositol alpha-mannosyltransferase